MKDPTSNGTQAEGPDDGDDLEAEVGACQLNDLPTIAAGVTPSPSVASSLASVDSSVLRVNLRESLTDESNDALVSLLLLVLQLDFYDAQHCSNKEFRRSTANLVLGHLQVSEKEAAERILELDANMCRGEVTDLVVILRSDPFVASNGAIVLLGELLAVFVRTGVYDSRYRVLLQHLSALLALRFDSVEAIEHKVAHLLTEEAYVESK